MDNTARFEWPTWAILIACYASFALASTWVAALWLPLGIALMVISVAFHSSLSHEVMHGHPFRNKHLNAVLVFPAFSFAVPYMRFRDTHLAHHEDSIITDPYDDPESNYFDPAVWNRMSGPMRRLFRINNTLAGRMFLGPLIGQVFFMRADLDLILKGDRRVLISWLWHIPAALLPVWWVVSYGVMPLWAYFLGVYLGLCVLKIRTFLEHRAHEDSRGRTVVVEDRGLLALLFLNNNFHSVHHQHPGVTWYDLPKLFRDNKERFMEINDNYYYCTYWDIFRTYLFKAKDPLPHPLWPKEGR